ncbi:LysR substrate-binding domain-containing protein [Stutzerimonas zhaodongensis]|uniref:LysR substrate-binding domain-containing protein n=1 Tax=Stutzerimonas zhaodongensis TaxID=1176257 RepID=UPI0039F07DEC
MIRDMDDAVRDAKDTVALMRGVIRIAALPTAAASFLPEAIAAFAQLYPGIEFRLRDGRAGEVLGWVRSGEVEAGISSSPDDVSGLSFEPLLDDNLVLLVRDEGQRRARWKTLPYIALTPDTSIRPLADAALRHLNVDPSPAWEVAHMSSAVALVSEGLGFPCCRPVAPRFSTSNAAMWCRSSNLHGDPSDCWKHGQYRAHRQ